MQKAEFAKILRDHKHTLKELKIEYDWRKAAIDKNMLMHGAKPSASSVNMATANEIMSHGLNVQKASTEALENTRRIISDTKEIGIDTIKKLDDHTNQITSMYGELNCVTCGVCVLCLCCFWVVDVSSSPSSGVMSTCRCVTVMHADNLTAIDTTLARTTKVIQRIARKIASDKSVMHTMYNANNAQYEQCNL